MGKTLEEVIKLKREVNIEFGNKDEYKDWITGFGVSEVDIGDKKDYCIRIYIKKDTPSHLKFPETYKDVKICLIYSDERYFMATN